MSSTQRADVAIIGAGIVGLAHAWIAAEQGKSVVVLERSPQAQGASIRNFGMIWPIGQMPGEAYHRAMRSRARWLRAIRDGNLWHDPCGSLHLAYADDEWAVMEEFVSRYRDDGLDVRLMSPTEIQQKYPAVQRHQLRGGLFSGTEICVDPRQAIAELPRMLREKHRVNIQYGVAVTDITMPHITTATGAVWEVERAVVCTGADFESLYPALFAQSGIRRCKLQMLRTRPQRQFRIGTMLAGGLTLLHYAAFRDCATLPTLKNRMHAQYADYLRYGIHVMASQNGLDEVVIGDSHEYDDDIQPWDKPEIDEMVLSYLRRMVELPDWTISGRWHGIYAKHPNQIIVQAQPHPRVDVVNALGGAGMTLSFGFAEEFWKSRL
ncbi:TIGR03364 family FAD-dependent oxidoreductase [Tuwongella immobilis]|uniref:FAD dependent oxidoreductase domain-containing protein n=1 Tax=Tuwongella immobilis TaxID=692036 RepID=A0A6C2YNS8_9BACT|nr:TIGR03364 family FAD-dependent oxidoreductase [Tuwongella immobilis]VIP02542.1 fad dependent oxidoreductase : FAD dependent oxidoreductase OS=Gloeocapsa sp. PCC 7428 GN=Glo7428_4949 PE=4 SV=1: DAO [Tuwongella immobilis]VTS01715.1 fad dependent oxidoreductase : FAD dependent oxidoreductase OS=Gloeocapsa sp. PCC 7428 GN=Glo7428_4949 PE=4 SV=1: DAO [Tuwongella immobilis]